MAGETVLAIDDEPDLLELLRVNLEKDGYTVITSSTGDKGLQIAKSVCPDLIILDLMLPGTDGLAICKQLKSQKATSSIPVILLTARAEEEDIITGLELGADDYIPKPFSPKVLRARVKARLRARDGEKSDVNDVIKIKNLTINTGRHEVFVDQSAIELTSTEFRVLLFLCKKPGYVFSRYQIVDGVKGVDYPVTERSVDVQVVALRKKLGTAGALIETVRGVGYKISDK